MQDNVIWDSISKLDFYLTNASTLTGATIDDQITVSIYETTADLSGATTAAEWSEYQTEKPAEL